ncbi:hypothetical protein EVG20_g4166 [Dentipellis fragilis]|uniref:CFEM domain-containing protein n=1 Tax=Dentipellis fragilis TaxID=205917 RepID=A0A4Y9YXD5_9AGAM|nr:hypothetical protein EVG20_g4166 [Dentipellis fragilis]
MSGSLNASLWAIVAIVAVICSFSTPLNAQTQEAPACAVSCATQVASLVGCSTISNTTCICLLPAFPADVGECIGATCQMSDLTSAENYLVALCSGGCSTLVWVVHSDYTCRLILSYILICTIVPRVHHGSILPCIGSSVNFVDQFLPVVSRTVTSTERPSIDKRSITLFHCRLTQPKFKPVIQCSAQGRYPPESGRRSHLSGAGPGNREPLHLAYLLRRSGDVCFAGFRVRIGACGLDSI